jgi:peptidoglycan/LPS O-acetylase OafA/YrhL
MDIDYNHRNFGLDFIRAIAILLVITSHASILLFPDYQNLLLYIIRFFGTIGVDLFFVLSGYLIGGILLKQINNGKTAFKDFFYFWIRRWFRTLPNYFLVLLINICLLYVFKLHVEGLWRYFFFLQNFTTAQSDFFSESWSLSIEEYAYVIGPLFLYLLLTLLKKTQQKRLLYLTVVFLIIVASVYLKYNFHTQHYIESDTSWSHEFRKVVIYRIDSIYFGFLAAYLFMYFKTFWNSYKKIAFFVGFILFFGMHFLIFVYNFRPENAAFFYNIFYLSLVSISLLLFFPFVITLNSSTFFKSIITRISILSYAIYLINYSIVLLTIQHFIDVNFASLFLKMGVLFIYLFATYFASLLLYVYFEKPLTNFRDNKYVKNKFIADNR